MEKEREIAIEILTILEEFLDDRNITIPSKDREGNPEEARIYGTEYYALEDKIAEIIKEVMEMKPIYLLEIYPVGEVMISEYYSTKIKAKNRIKGIEKAQEVKLENQKDYEISKIKVL